MIISINLGSRIFPLFLFIPSIVQCMKKKVWRYQMGNHKP